MKKLMFLTIVFGLMMVLTGAVSAQNKGNGRVLTVNDDNKPKTTEFSPKNGDQIVTAITTRGNDSYGLKKGFKYTQLEVRQPNKIMYFYYATDTPALQDIINGKNTKVSGVCTNSKPFKANDAITIQSQPENDGTLVTFTSSTGCFSFNVK